MALNNYRYIALDMRGKQVKGFVEAPNQELAFRLLKHQNLTPQEFTKVNTLFTRLNNFTIGRTFTPKHLAFFLSQLGAILEAKITVLTALELLAIQEHNRHLRRMYFRLYQDVFNGFQLHEALAKYPKDFPQILINMVESSFLTGSLAETIAYMADYFDREQKLQRKIKSAYQMPLLYLALTVGVSVGLMTFVYPEIADLFSSFENARMPAITIMYLNLSTFMTTYGNEILITVVSMLVLFFIFFHWVKPFRRFMTRVILHIPLFGQLIQMNNQIIILNMLANMIQKDVKILDAMKSIENVLSNIVYKELINHSIKDVFNGYPISKQFAESKFIDPIMARMMEVGEETGDISQLLIDLSYYYTKTVDSRTDRIKAILQPSIMIVVYAIVGSMIIALMLPMIQLGTQI